MKLDRKKHIPVMICLSVPAFLLTVAYMKMAIFYEKFWLFDTIVHENGRYTLLEVIFYFRHFTWEILIKAVYTIFIVGAFYYYGRPSIRVNKIDPSNVPVNQILYSCLFASLIILIAVFMTAKEYSFKETLLGLFQYRTSDVRPPEFGSHWRNHFLSNIVLFSTSAFLIVLYRTVFHGCWSKRRFSKLFFFSLGIFTLLTFFFGFTIDPFDAPSYLGHQVREIFGSDLPIIMFLTMAVLIYMEGKHDSGEIDLVTNKQIDRKKIASHLVFWSIPAILPTGFLILKVMSLDINSNIATLGNTKDWSILDLFAWHFYEHSLDYLFVVSFVYFLYLLTLRIEIRKAINEE